MSRLIMIAREQERRRKRNLIVYRMRLREQSIPLDLPEREFIANFRLSKQCFLQLCNELSPLLSSGRYQSKTNIKIRVLATLTFLASGSYQRPVGNSYSLGLSQSAISLAIHEVVDALNNPRVFARHVKFPQNRQEREDIMKGFMEKFGIPGVIGCIDGTHVAMIRPTEADHEELFFNRKNYHSLNVQIICDSDLNLIHVDATFGGAAHDSYIFNNSTVSRHLSQLTENGEAVWLLGDLGYPQRPFMMTPIPNAAEGSPEAHYTNLQIKARNTVERCIGVLKSRWRCLLAHRVLHYRHNRVAKIVKACCVLHNIANKHRLPTPTLDVYQQEQDHQLQEHHFNLDAGGADSVRAQLVRRLWADRNN